MHSIRIGAAKAAHTTETMKTDTNKQNPTHEIRQNGKAVLRSDCEFSLPMISTISRGEILQRNRNITIISDLSLSKKWALPTEK